MNPGDVLAGKLEVERVLGAGGMGVVVAARHLELDQRVAVKFLHPEAMSSGEATARFVREARVAAKIRSEHVARVIDVGRLENGAPYIVMEYLEGGDLSAEVAKGPIPVEDAVDYVVQACDAMAEAHALGIVHRDLKPANLFLTHRTDGAPVVKVLDFGISKLQVPTAADGGLSKTTAMIGSPYYMSPEQMKAPRGVDYRTDIWSLGCILYELLTGQVPFRGETLPELAVAISLDPPQPIEQLRTGLPPELSQAVMRALAKDREQRFQHVGEFASALAPFAPRRSRFTLERLMKLSGGGDVASTQVAAEPRLVLASSMGGTAATANATWGGATTKDGRASRTGVVLGLAALVVVGGGAAAFFALRSPAAAPEAAAPTEAPAAIVPPTAAEPAIAAPVATPSSSALTVLPALSATAAASAPPKPAPVPRTAAKPTPGKPAPVAAAPPPAPEPAPAPAPAPAPTTPARRQNLKLELK